MSYARVQDCIKVRTAQKTCADAAALAHAAIVKAALADADEQIAFTASLNLKPSSEAALEVARSNALTTLADQYATSVAAIEAQSGIAHAENELLAAINNYIDSKEIKIADAITPKIATSVYVDKGGNMLSFEWKIRLLITAMVVAGFTISGGFFYFLIKKSPETPLLSTPRLKGEPLGLDESSAQVFCEENIKRVAKDPDTVKVPFVLNQKRGETYEFQWNSQTSLIRMRNGLGLEVPVSASCSVSATTGAIKSLTLDGQKII